MDYNFEFDEQVDIVMRLDALRAELQKGDVPDFGGRCLEMAHLIGVCRNRGLHQTVLAFNSLMPATWVNYAASALDSAINAQMVRLYEVANLEVVSHDVARDLVRWSHAAWTAATVVESQGVEGRRLRNLLLMHDDVLLNNPKYLANYSRAGADLLAVCPAITPLWVQRLVAH